MTRYNVSNGGFLFFLFLLVLVLLFGALCDEWWVLTIYLHLMLFKLSMVTDGDGVIEGMPIGCSKSV